MEIESIQSFLYENGYTSLSDYLSSLSEDYGVPLHIVTELYNLLGPSEIADGLISALESASNSDWD